MATPLDVAIANAQKAIPECVAVGFVDMKTGMLLGVKTIDSHPQEVLDLVAAATGDLFQGSNVTAIESMFKKVRGVRDDGAHYFQEIIVNSDNLVHVFQRGKRNQDMVLVSVCRVSANLGMVLAKSRAALPAGGGGLSRAAVMTVARSWRDGLLALLGAIDRSGSGAGAWQFGGPDRPAGVVLVEHGRVCWATAAGTRRLTDLLIERHGLDRRDMEDLYRRCQQDHAPLGQTMVDTGLITADDLRGALLEQTAEAMVVLATDTSTPAWLPHRGTGYHAQFTFSTAELTARATALSLGVDPSARAHALEGLLGGGGWGAAFVGDAPPLPVAITGDAELEATLALGRWAQGVLATWARTQHHARFAAAWTPRGAMVAWRDPDGVCAAVCDDTATFSRLLARHVRTAEG